MVRLVVVERMGWDSSVWTMDYNLPIKRFFPVFWLIHWRKKLLTIDTHLLSCACTTKSCFSATGSRRGGSRSFLTCKPQWCPSRCTEMQHSGIRNAGNNFPPHKQKSSMKRKRSQLKRICKENYALTFTICHTSKVWQMAGNPAATSSSFKSLKWKKKKII